MEGFKEDSLNDNQKEIAQQSRKKIKELLELEGKPLESVDKRVFAGLLAADIIKKDEDNPIEDVTADDAFELLDVNKDGVIEMGDIETLLTAAKCSLDDINAQRDAVFDEHDGNENGKISREEWECAWKEIKEILNFKEIMSDEVNATVADQFGPDGPKDIPLYALGTSQSFYKLPPLPENLENWGQGSQEQDGDEKADCVFFGCPFDSSVSYRTGARFGPAAVRKASLMTGFGYAPWINKDFSKMKIYDAGDAAATPYNIQHAVHQVAQYASKLWKSSKCVIGIGGDHMLSWSYLSAARDNHGRVAVIHLDSHLDTGDVYANSKFSHGTALKRAMDAKCIDVDHSVHVGIHGSMGSQELLKKDKWLTITMDEFDEEGPAKIAEICKERVGDMKCVISFDVDVMEPGECPGIGFPEPGGMTSRELFKFLRGLRGVNCIGGEVCEFTPEYDVKEVTAHCCAQAAYEIMCLALENIPAEAEVPE